MRSQLYQERPSGLCGLDGGGGDGGVEGGGGDGGAEGGGGEGEAEGGEAGGEGGGHASQPHEYFHALVCATKLACMSALLQSLEGSGEFEHGGHVEGRRHVPRADVGVARALAGRVSTKNLTNRACLC